MRKTLMVLLSLFIIGCASLPRPSEILDCDVPAGREYVCYSDKECSEYLEGYSAIMTMKTCDFGDCNGWGQGEEHPVVYLNLFYDHKSRLLLGRWEAEEREGRWYIKAWIAVYDMECNLLYEDYSEGFRKELE